MASGWNVRRPPMQPMQPRQPQTLDGDDQDLRTHGEQDDPYPVSEEPPAGGGQGANMADQLGGGQGANMADQLGAGQGANMADALSRMNGGGGGGGGYGGPGGGGGGGYTPPPAGAGGTPSDQDIIRQTYREIIERSNKPVDPNDPNIRLQADRYGAGVERQRRNYLADVAEGAGPYATGEMRGQNRMMSERAGQMIGGFEAELIGREIESRRNDVLAALNGLHGVVSESERNALQAELARLDRDLGYARLQQEQSQFEDQFNYRMGRDEVEDNYRAMQFLLNQGD